MEAETKQSQGDKAIRVLIFDDSKSIRESIEILFSSDNRFHFCGAFESAALGNEAVSLLKPDLVLMDVDMPEVNGIDAVGKLRIQFPDLAIVMLTVFDDDNRIFESLRNGAIGYMLKSTPPHRLLDALEEVSQGGAPMSPSIARRVMNYFQAEPKQETLEYNLSAREKEVLALLVEGYSYKMAAHKLDIGFETVRTYVKKIYEKLHVRNLAEAVSKSVKEKLV